ncbi:hypothetical protein C8Q80DRAFT_1170391 [Daedaleopsis nitida]|nr:hypothetical protein C8Q80DRAFT_1170391 [Daedaleopsis nitida]
MSIDTELDDLSKQTQSTAPGDSGSEPHPTELVDHPVDDGVVSSWAWTSAALLLVVAIPLILSPKLLLFLSETGMERRASLTPLESFLAWNTGILLSALSVALVMNVPSGPADITARRETPGHPLLEPLSAACLLISFLSYNTSSVGSLGFLLCLGSGTIGLWGVWAIMFAGSSKISRKTGADKRTSRFLFGNKSAASTQKKRWKKEQADSRSKDM